MSRHTLRLALVALALVVGIATAGVLWAAEPATPPPANYKKVSTLVPLPEFIPGLGTLYVDPKTLPVGPFLAYNREGKLVGSIYRVPVKDLEAKKAFNDLAAANEKVDHVDLYYNAGHPGVAEPHYHIAVWYVSPDQVAQLKQ
jgi:hypothetical protein